MCVKGAGHEATSWRAVFLDDVQREASSPPAREVRASAGAQRDEPPLPCGRGSG
ncbi:protein of unassigned function [Methylobacterium oryzae CBMB20]|uniref:Protein of unassigned function n=1 Tax=Methylobacterium oryzae CBMB20 TaxID=693986 RepID=A0A089NX49_9HYPH|nr:protein of unassigned function [Methylobacterium oryzae CBMB20]